MWRVLVVAVVLSQSWSDAYRARDYDAASQLLHAIVLPPDYTMHSQDPAPARHLATMYAQGLGLPRDPVGACSLAHVAAWVTRQTAPTYAHDLAAYTGAVKEADGFVGEHCDRLPEPLRKSATAAQGCFAFAMPETVLAIGGHLVRVGHGGIGVVDAPDSEVVGLLNCPQFIARLRATSIDPPPDAAKGVGPRHVMEIFSWALSSLEDGTRAYELQWLAYEIRGETVVVGAFTHFPPVPVWPRSPVLNDFDAQLTMKMDRAGRVRWEAPAAKITMGWLPVPD